MAVADPLLSEWFESSGFGEYSDILTNDLGVEDYDDFRLLRDERDVNELLDDMANLKEMDEAFKQRFKKEMLSIIATPLPPKRKSPSTKASKSTSSSSSISSNTNPPAIHEATSAPVHHRQRSNETYHIPDDIATATESTASSSKPKVKRPSSTKSKESKHKRLASTPIKPTRPKISKAVSADGHNSLTLTVGKSKKSKSKPLSPALEHSQSVNTESVDTFAMDSPPAAGLKSGSKRKSERTSSPMHSKSKKSSHFKASKSMGVLPDMTHSNSKKRKMGKQEKNKTRTGGTVHANRRVRLDDGRIGVVKFKGRTAFGKSGEDWIGIVVEYGKGQHNGTVNGKNYFRCREGKGIMVRPDRIIEDLGNPMTKELDDTMKRGSEEIQELLKQIARERREERMRKKRAAEAAAAKRESSNYGGDVGWSAKEYQQDDSEMFGQKLMHSKTLLDKNKDAKATKKKKMDEI